MPSLVLLLLLPLLLPQLLWLTVAAAASNFSLPCHGSRCCFCLSNRLLRLISLQLACLTATPCKPWTPRGKHTQQAESAGRGSGMNLPQDVSQLGEPQSRYWCLQLLTIRQHELLLPLLLLLCGNIFDQT
jgi:hypothetical protein